MKSDPSMTYGELMCYKFCLLFKQIYFQKKNERQEFSESFKDDVCACLSVLLLSSSEAKITAIQQNLVQKLSEKASVI